MTKDRPPQESPFVRELQQMLEVRGLSWRRFAELAGYHPSWLSKIKNGAPPSDMLVRRCDEVLNANGALIALASVQISRPVAQLPAPLAGFVGREHELDLMRVTLTREPQLDASRIVFIEGTPGVGKTSAAIRCAYEIQGAEPKAYPDGELHINLQGFSPKSRPVRPTDALEEFLIELGTLPQDIPEHIDRRAKLYRSILRSRRILILLDNAASIDQIEPLLPESRHCGVIVTSRKKFPGLAMRVGAERLKLGPLSSSDAVTILGRAIGVDVSSAQAKHLAVLADQCGRLPLALRISAERLAVHPHRPLRDLIDELAVEHERLDGLSTGESHAVRTVFEWSYNDLSSDEQRMFRRLSLHPGPHFGVGAAAAVGGMTVIQARRLLEKLASVHLLDGTPDDRYQFHDLLRFYAASKATESDEKAELESAVLRLMTWYQHTVAAAGRALAPFRLNPLQLQPATGVVPQSFSTAAAALTWCDAEAENFIPVIKAATEHGFHEVSWKTAVALFDYLRLLRNPGGLWLVSTSVALDAARAADDRYAEGWVETSLAEGYRWLRQYKWSRHHFEHALRIRREIGDRQGTGWSTAGLGFLAIDCGRLEQAREHALAAMAIFRETGDRHGEASALFTLADTYQSRGSLDDALKTLRQSLEIFQSISNCDGQALALTKIADVLLARGEPGQALATIESSIEARRRAGSQWGEADGLVRRARILRELARPEEARRSLQSAAALYSEVDEWKAVRIRSYLEDETMPPMASILSSSVW
ncbi:tetratricopeptide repeat protein [Actinomadura monticuli]|uniref:Tetratricopeptide repeat protein n=1 Tax=Actinomadura monticuli TaxID=3097367 RepID=A0ABV4Q6P7_9ACTN